MFTTLCFASPSSAAAMHLDFRSGGHFILVFWISDLQHRVDVRGLQGSGHRAPVRPVHLHVRGHVLPWGHTERNTVCVKQILGLREPLHFNQAQPEILCSAGGAACN